MVCVAILGLTLRSDWLGVGEWAKHGVDSSQYSNKLSTSAQAIFEKDAVQDPEALMQRAYEESKGIVGTR
jgi:hypothetical protein